MIVMLEVRENNGKFLALRAHGRLRRLDYDRILPMMEQAISAHAPIRVVLEVDDFHGWTPAALAEQLKFDLANRKQFERVAVVGGGRVTRLLASSMRPFFTAQVRLFAQDHARQARAWATEGTNLEQPATAPHDSASKEPMDIVDEASEESFPASDSPGYTPSRM